MSPLEFTILLVLVYLVSWVGATYLTYGDGSDYASQPTWTEKLREDLSWVSATVLSFLFIASGNAATAESDDPDVEQQAIQQARERYADPDEEYTILDYETDLEAILDDESDNPDWLDDEDEDDEDTEDDDEGGEKPTPSYTQWFNTEVMGDEGTMYVNHADGTGEHEVTGIRVEREHYAKGDFPAATRYSIRAIICIPETDPVIQSFERLFSSNDTVTIAGMEDGQRVVYWDARIIDVDFGAFGADSFDDAIGTARIEIEAAQKTVAPAGRIDPNDVDIDLCQGHLGADLAEPGLEGQTVYQ